MHMGQVGEGPGRLVLSESLGATARVQSTLAWAAALSAPTPEVGTVCTHSGPDSRAPVSTLSQGRLKCPRVAGSKVGSRSLCILSGRAAPASSCPGRTKLVGVSSAPEPSVGAEHLMEDQVPT